MAAGLVMSVDVCGWRTGGYGSDNDSFWASPQPVTLHVCGTSNPSCAARLVISDLSNARKTVLWAGRKNAPPASVICCRAPERGSVVRSVMGRTRAPGNRFTSATMSRKKSLILSSGETYRNLPAEYLAHPDFAIDQA